MDLRIDRFTACSAFARHAIGNTVRYATVALLLACTTSASFAQTRLYVVNGGDGTVSVIDTSNNHIVATIIGPAPLLSITYNPNDGMLYLPTQEGDGKVHVLNPATLAFLKNPIAVGAFPSYMTISPKSDRGYVSNQFGGLSVVDMKKRSVITELMGVTAPLGSALATESGKLYVINNQQSEVSVVDATSNTVLRSLPIGCLNPIDIKVDAELHKAFATKSSCSEVAVIDTRTDAVSAVITLPGGPPRRPQFLVIDPIAHRAYVTVTWGSDEDGLSGGVAILDTADNSIVGGIELGESPSRLALDISEHRLYVADRRGESVFVIDTQSNIVLGEIPVGSDPTDIAIVPAGHSKAN